MAKQEMHVRQLSWKEAAAVVELGGDVSVPDEMAAMRMEWACGCYEDMVRLVHTMGHKTGAQHESEHFTTLRNGHGVTLSGRCEQHLGNNIAFRADCLDGAAELLSERAEKERPKKVIRVAQKAPEIKP